MFGVSAGLFVWHANRKTFYSLCVLSIIPNCNTNIVRVLLAVDLKQAMIFVVICHTVVILCEASLDNFL